MCRRHLTHRGYWGVILAVLLGLGAGDSNTKAEDMAATATLTLDHTNLLYQQIAIGTAELRNGGRDPLRLVNPKNMGAGPTIEVTELSTGNVTRFNQPVPQGVPLRPRDLAPGKTFEREFALSDFVKLPGPGEYELRAVYQWEGGKGEAVSSPVKLVLRPSNPRSASVESTHGGAGPYFAIAWSGPSHVADGKHGVYISTLSAVKRPRVTECTHLTDLDAPVEPYVSVPPNTVPDVQWVAWIEESKLRYMLHQSGATSALMSARLPSPHCQIVPPLLQNPPSRSDPRPGATVVLYERIPESIEGALHVMHLSSNGAVRNEPPLAVTGPSPRWMETAYLSSHARFTFLASTSVGQTSLRVLHWSRHAGLKPPEPLAEFQGDCIGGDIWLTKENQVVGALLIETGPEQRRRYAFHTWKFNIPNKFELGQQVDLSVPTDMPLESAIVSVNEAGWPHAIIRGAGKGQPWFYCNAKGTVMPLPREAENFQTPMRVLYRRTTDPTIMYTVPGKGFQFAKPD